MFEMIFFYYLGVCLLSFDSMRKNLKDRKDNERGLTSMFILGDGYCKKD